MMKDRTWLVDSEPYALSPDEDELFQELLNVYWLLKRMGGAVILTAQREEVAPEFFETTSVVAKYVYSPAKRLPDEQPDEAVPESSQEPGEAEGNGQPEVLVERG